MVQIKKATKKQIKLRMGLSGPTGSGKTFTALVFAKALGPKVLVIDTENRSASRYADQFDFDVIELDQFSPANYLEAIRAGEDGGYDVIVIDSITHEWSGSGGILEKVDNNQARNINKQMAWNGPSQEHTKFLESLVRCRCHLIATMRSKMEYAQERDERGKTIVRKVGLAPIQREGVEYEFDFMLSITTDHVLAVEKSRLSAIDGKIARNPDASFMVPVIAWLNSGDAVELPPPTPAPQQAPPPPPPPTQTVPYPHFSKERVATDPDAAAINAEIIDLTRQHGRDDVIKLIERLASGMTPPIPPGPYTGELGHFRTLVNNVAVKLGAGG